MKSFATLSATVALLSGTTNAFWRMECHSRTGLARLDPLVDTGKVGSHAHAIHGGNNFGMDTTYEDLRASNCTSCLATDDKSAYWTPAMMFQHDNGTTEVVPQVGGMLAYYLLYSNTGETLEAFPEGFRMLAGDTRLRNFSGPVPDPEKSLWGPDDKTQHALGQKAIGMNCLNYAKTPEPSMYRHFLPDKAYLDDNCVDGIRAEIMFPSCWNGDKDSDNHKSHMAYPDLVNAGTCPEGFDRRVPSLFFETIWNTYAFKGLPGKFLFANGDPTAYGYHGDFIMGWTESILQSAVETCTNPSGLVSDCKVFDLQTEAECDECKMTLPEVLDNDDCAGPADGLCGNVPVQFGPAYASLINPGNTEAPTAAPTTIAPSDIPAVPTLGYTTPKNAATDKYGGGISIQNVRVSQVSEANAEAPPTPVAQAVTSSSSPAPSSSSPAPAAPAPTQPPAAEQPQGSIISHTTYTSAGKVYEVAIEEVQVYVTVEPSQKPEQKPKRHAHHMHLRRDREHGLLGRH